MKNSFRKPRVHKSRKVLQREEEQRVRRQAVSPVKQITLRRMKHEWDALLTEARRHQCTQEAIAVQQPNRFT